jgi:arylsulfatase A-like enzyme
MDFFPTILQAVGLKSDPSVPLDGESLMSLLKQDGQLSRDAVYFHYPNYAFHQDNRLGSAIREGDFKLIERFDDDSVELYNLRDDIGETKNLAETMPDLSANLLAKLRSWRKKTGAAMPRPVRRDAR